MSLRLAVLLVCLTGSNLLPCPARAQMVTGRNIPGFRAAFGLAERGEVREVTVEQLGSTPPANILHPGESLELQFKLTNKSGEALDLEGRWDVIRYGTKSRPGDVWVPDLFKIADVGSSPVRVECAVGKAVVVTVRAVVPETFGCYAAVLDLGPRGRLFAAPFVRVPAPDPGRVQFPTYALDMPWPHEISVQTFKLFQRLGIKGCRHGLGYYPATQPESADRWKRIQRELQEMQEHDITVMVTIGEGGAPPPRGRPRPWLKEDGTMLENVKEDYAWLPAWDADFQQWCHQLAATHGWPKGPVNAVELWNEPWEGVSISGWGADTLRFREMYEHMARGTVAGREAGGTDVLVGGACSSANTRDKLFADGTDRFLPWLDFVSIHYQPLAADPALEPKWMTRQAKYGPVRVWDTESWIANSEDRVAGVIASMRSMGQDRTAGVYHGNVYEMQWNQDLEGRKVSVVHTWAPAAAVAATQKLIGQRPLRELLFTNGLPWIYRFDGVASADDGTLVVLGDLGAIYDRNRTLFRGVRLGTNASLTLPAGGGQYVLLDFYGNPLPSAGGEIRVPLNGLGYFLRTTGQAGSFARLVEAVREAAVQGLDPVAFEVADFTTTATNRPALRVKLTNVLNRRVQGRLALDGALRPSTPTALDRLELAPHETRWVAVELAPFAPREDNLYPAELRFDAGADGLALHTEALRVNVIARRSVTVDGRFDDWPGALPQPVSGDGIRANLTETAWLPFKDHATNARPGVAVGFLAADDAGFYFAATVVDDTPWSGGPRYETRDDDSYFYPETVFGKPKDGRKELTWPAGVRRFTYRRDFEVPSGNGTDNLQIAFNVLPPDAKGLYTHPAGTMPRYMIYADTDYEFALNPVAERFGGGTEIWCLQRPGMVRKHFFPRQPRAAIDGGPVKEGRLVIRREGNTRFVECALPWSVIPEVRARRDAGQPVKFSFRVNDNRGPAYELAAGRSVSKENPFAFHNDWATHWANELEFGWER